MNESLLKTIDSIEELTMEAEMDVIYAMEQEYFKVMTLCEYCSPEAVSYIMEADNTTPTPEGSKPPKEGIFKKIGRVLKALLEAIKKKATALLNKLSGGRFNKDLKNVKGTPSQAMEEVRKKKGKSGQSKPYTVKRGGGVVDFFTLYMTADGKRGFKYDPKVKAEMLAYNRKNHMPIIRLIQKKQYASDNRDIAPAAVMGYMYLLKFFLDNRDEIDKSLKEIINALNDFEKKQNDSNYIIQYGTAIKNADAIFQRYVTTDTPFELSEEDIKKISEGVSKILEGLPSIGNFPEYNDNYKFTGLLNRYNDYIAYFSAIQMCMNAMFKKLDIIFELDDSDKNSCDAYDLDAFIEELLIMNYPEKYIHTLAYQAAKPEMKDGCKEAKWGQFRGCLIPKNGDVVYKYALCRKGTKDNENEYDIYKKFVDNGLSTVKYLCKPEVYPSFHNVLGMEKVGFNFKKSFRLPGEIVEQIDNELKSKNINVKLEDIHYQNIGFRKDKTPVITDYGSARVNKPDHLILNALGMKVIWEGF